MFGALRIISGLGLPTKYGVTPVAFVISAATDPVAGSAPSPDGPVASGLVATNRAPLSISLIVRVMPEAYLGAMAGERDLAIANAARGVTRQTTGRSPGVG